MTKRKQIDNIIDDNDILIFKEELLLHLNGEGSHINDNNDIDSNEERVIKQLSFWLRKTYSYDVLRQLLTSKEIRETLDIDVYWLLHITCTLHFSDFIINIDDDKLVDFIRNSMELAFNSIDDMMITSIISSIILFLFDITVNHDDQNNENRNRNQINESKFSLNLSLKTTRCLQIIEEIAIKTANSNINEYSSSSKELLNAIKDTRNLKKRRADDNSLHLDQSPLEPIYIGSDDFQKFVMTLKIIYRDSNAAAVAEWQTRQLCRLLSCILTSINNFDKEALEDFDYMIKKSIFSTIDRELRSTSVSSLDFTYNTWTTECCKSNEITAISFVLDNVVIEVDGTNKRINYEMINGLIRLATVAALDGVAEDSSMQWLRSVCLIQHLAYITQGYDDNSSKMELGLKLLSNWFDTVLGPSGKPNDSNKQQEPDPIELHPLSSKSFGFACLAFCEIVDMVSEECLQVMCNAVRLRKVLNKEAADSFLQVGRMQLKTFHSLRKSSSAGDEVNSRSLDITEERIIQWCRTLDSTGHLPVAVLQQCNMIGVNGYKIVLSCMKLLIADNPAIRDNCNRIVKAMSTSKTPLCSISEASDFVADEITYEGKLDVILATLSIPSAHKVHVKVALQTLQSVNGLVSKILSSTESNSNALSYLQSWKSSSRQSIVSVYTTANIDLRLKIAGLLMTNLLQTITLLASQLHIILCSSMSSKIIINQSFVYWYEWMYEAIDTFSDDSDAINSVSSIFYTYLVGDSIGIIQFPGLALFISLANEALIEKIFTTLLSSCSKNSGDCKDAVVRKFCGVVHAALSWSGSALSCYDGNQVCNIGNYLKTVHPLLSSIYIWTYSSSSTSSPLPHEFSTLLETLCPIIIDNKSDNKNSEIISLLASSTFQTVLQWIINYRVFFCHDGIVNKMQPLLTMVIGSLNTDVVITTKSIKLRELQKNLKYPEKDKIRTNDFVYFWSTLLDCIGSLFDMNKKNKGYILDDSTTMVVRNLIIIIAKEINLYQSNSWQLWMKCAKADIEKYGSNSKSSISLFVALTIINEGYHHDVGGDGILNDYALWYSYLISSKYMAIAKSIDIDFFIGYSALSSLTQSSKATLFCQIPSLLSSEVCNRIIIMGNNLQMMGAIDLSTLTICSFSNCIVEDISHLLDLNRDVNDMHLFSENTVVDCGVYPRTLGWTFLSATAICRIDDSEVKSALLRILNVYNMTTNEKNQKMENFLVGLLSSFILSSSSTNLISTLLENKNMLPSAKVSEELRSQLPPCIATEYVVKFQSMINGNRR